MDTKNPFFARAVANRYWAHFFGRGIVDPLDDMRVTNPPSNPELLRCPGQGIDDQQVQPQASGADDLQEPDLSATSSAPNEFNKHDKAGNYARYYPKRMASRGTVRRGLPGDR